MAGKKKRKCGACSKRGHNVRTCPNATYRDKLLKQQIHDHARVTYTLMHVLNECLGYLGVPGATLNINDGTLGIEGMPELEGMDALTAVKFAIFRHCSLVELPPRKVK